jgi:hypothetical protein
MHETATFTAADITAATRALLKARHHVDALHVLPDGTILGIRRPRSRAAQHAARRHGTIAAPVYVGRINPQTGSIDY